MGIKINRKLRELRQAARRFGWFYAAKYGWQALNRLCLKFRVNYINAAIPARFPTQVDIEVTNVCNLKCPSCPRSHNNIRPEHLDPEKLNLLLDRLPFKPLDVLVGGVGEPLTNPCLGELINVLAERKIECRLFTNGTLLNSRLREMLLAKKNLKSVTVSVDGATRESFEQLRHGADFEKWREQISEFNRKAKQDRPRSLFVATNTVVSKNNIDEMSDIVSFAARLGFQHMQLIDMIPMNQIAADMVVPVAQYDAMLERAIKLSRQFNLNVSYSHRQSKQPPEATVRCMMPWNYMLVKVNGDIQACCALFGDERKPVMGNLFDEEFNEIWHGKKIREYRVASVKGENTQLCSVCPYY